MTPYLAYVLHLAHIASLSPLHAQVLFWSFVNHGDSRMAAYVQEVAELQKPSAQVFTLADYRKAA